MSHDDTLQFHTVKSHDGTTISVPCEPTATIGEVQYSEDEPFQPIRVHKVSLDGHLWFLVPCDNVDPTPHPKADPLEMTR